MQIECEKCKNLVDVKDTAKIWFISKYSGLLDAKRYVCITCANEILKDIDEKYKKKEKKTETIDEHMDAELNVWYDEEGQE